MRETAREIDPASQSPETHTTPGEPAGLSGGRHCPMDSVLSSLQTQDDEREREQVAQTKKTGDRQTSRVSLNRLRLIEHGLDPIGRDLLGFLSKFTIATTDQLRRVFYSDRISRHAGELAVWRLLHRLEHDRLIALLPRRVGGITGGSTPNLWHLTNAGNRLNAINADTNTTGRYATRIRANDPPALSTLNHRLMLSETYVRLCELKNSRLLDVLDFDTEPTCWRRFMNLGGGTITLKPDAYARTAAHGSEYERLWFIEIDMNTESPATIRSKSEVYEAYRRSGLEQERQGVFPKVVRIVPDEQRARRLNRVFKTGGLVNAHEAMSLDMFITHAAECT
jgi:hypothetical protein